MMFADEHDFVNYPELTNSEIDTFGFLSPHEQITEDFKAVVVKVHDGDTVTLRADFRDFDFPLRFSKIDAPELNTGVAGEEARDFLKSLVEGEDVEIVINKLNRVDKYGRLLGELFKDGLSVEDMMLMFGYAEAFDRRLEHELPNLDKVFAVKKWF